MVDPALWHCRHINSLTLRLGPALTTLTPASGPGIGALKVGWHYTNEVSEC